MRKSKKGQGPSVMDLVRNGDNIKYLHEEVQKFLSVAYPQELEKCRSYFFVVDQILKT